VAPEVVELVEDLVLVLLLVVGPEGDVVHAHVVQVGLAVGNHVFELALDAALDVAHVDGDAEEDQQSSKSSPGLRRTRRLAP
jgi:hypothetical protein